MITITMNIDPNESYIKMKIINYRLNNIDTSYNYIKKVSKKEFNDNEIQKIKSCIDKILNLFVTYQKKYVKTSYFCHVIRHFCYCNKEHNKTKNDETIVFIIEQVFKKNDFKSGSSIRDKSLFSCFYNKHYTSSYFV